MSTKDRIRELTERVDRIEMAMLYPLREVKCPSLEVNINNDPEIIGNVMRWQGKDYLRFDFVPETDAEKSARKARFMTKCGEIWIPFSDIPITDALARMRTDKQPIWVMVTYYNTQKARDWYLREFIGKNCSAYATIRQEVKNWEEWENTIESWGNCRLANIDDLKKAGIR